MSPDEIREAVERCCSEAEPLRDDALDAVALLLDALETGRVRAAEPTDSGWRVNAWVKRGILLGFRVGADRSQSVPPVFHFRDRETFPTLDPEHLQRDVRVVPGGTTIRRGAYLDRGVVVMPPAYVNVGAWVGAGSMIDSHVLVGSCAQIGRRVHLSAAVQVGGVLEPVGACPVIVDDDVFLGGGCGVYEGIRVGAGAVLAPGVVLTAAVPLYDLVHEKVHRAAEDGVLRVPEGAVVVPGSRPARGEFAIRSGIQLEAPVIVKYRDPGTDAALTLESALR